MPTIEETTEDVTLGEDDLCLSPNGWGGDLTKVSFRLEGGMTLEQAMQRLWEQHQNLLGEGALIFKVLENDPLPTGYIIFKPAQEST